MKKFLTMGMAVAFMAATSGLVLADGITPTSSISTTTKTAKKGHGCHGKCNKGTKSSTPTTK